MESRQFESKVPRVGKRKGTQTRSQIDSLINATIQKKQLYPLVTNLETDSIKLGSGQRPGSGGIRASQGDEIEATKDHRH